MLTIYYLIKYKFHMMHNKTFLKYAGNKQSYMHLITPYFDWSGVTCYVEPFCGALGAAINSGAVERDIEIHLSDANSELINLYERLTIDPSGVESIANTWDSTEDTYYTLRSWDRVDEWQTMHTSNELAARTLYVNRHCFNGLYRINRNGQFNVSWNKNTSPLEIKVSSLGHALKVCERAKFSCEMFEDVLQRCGRGDLVYCDPPYVNVNEPKRKFNGYVGAFDWTRHLRLRDELLAAGARGAHVYVSNSYTEATLELYEQFSVVEITDVRRTISADGKTRGSVSELLAWK